MGRWTFRTSSSTVLACVLCWFALCWFGLAAAPGIEAQETATYRVEVNGRVEKLVFLLVAPDGRLAAGRSDLMAWGLLESAGPRAHMVGVPESVELYWLNEINDIEAEVDQDLGLVRLKPTPESLTSRLSARQRPTPDYELQRGWAVDLTYRGSARSRPRDRPLLDLRGGLGVSLGPLGRLQSRLDFGQRTVATAAAIQGAGMNAPAPPLFRDVQLRRDFGEGYVFHVGQLNGTPGSAGSGLHYLGASVGVNALGRTRTTLSNRYARFTDLVTLAEPATVEVRVNGRVIANRVVGVGRLSIDDIPIDAGSNEVQVQIRHSDGRIEVFEQSIVGGVDLVAGGESELGVALGVLREGGHFESNLYSDPFGSVSYARGLSDSHTIRLSAEGRSGVSRHAASRVEWSGRLPGSFLASVGLSVNNSLVPDGPVLGGPTNSPQAAWYPGAASGNEAEVQVSREFGGTHVSIGGSRASERYLTMRQDGFAQESRWRGRVDWLLRATPLGSVGLQYRFHEEWGEAGSHSGFASIQRRLMSGSVRLRAGYDGRRETGGLTGSIGLNLPVGLSRTRAHATVRGSATAVESAVTISKSIATNAHGVSWALRAGHRTPRGLGSPGGSSASGDVSLLMRNSVVETRLNARLAGDGNWSASGEVAGSLVLIGGSLFATSPIGASYVLVDAGEAEGVAVLQDRRNVGVVNRNGTLLLPFVSALSLSQIELDSRSLSAGFIAERLRERAAFAPGGSTVAFAVRRSLQALLTLLDAEGEPWPSGTHVRTVDGRVLGFVGKKGLTHLADLTPGETLQAVAGSRTCEFRIALSGAATGISQLGEVNCGS